MLRMHSNGRFIRTDKRFLSRQPAPAVTAMLVLIVIIAGSASSGAQSQSPQTTAPKAPQAIDQKLPVDPTKKPRLGPEEIAAIKVQNARAAKMNEIVARVNTAMEVKDWSVVESGSRQLLEMEPGKYSYYSMLGAALLNLEKCEEGLTVLDKGIQLAQDVTAPEDAEAKAKATTSLMLGYQGHCYLKQKKSEEAVAAFTKAEPLDPRPGVVNFNLCATYYNMMVYEKKTLDRERLKAAVASCNKSIDADSSRAPAYFIKGAFLIAQTADHHGNVTFPPEAIVAIKKYLELDPKGLYVSGAKELLESAGEKVK